METIQLVAPCHFGMEAVLKREIYDLGYDITKVEDGRVTFEGDLETICRSNIFLRTAERVMVQIGRFRATTFDELYENMKALPWEDWIPQDGKFWVKKETFQCIGYPVHLQKGNGRPFEDDLSYGLVQRGRRFFSGANLPIKR